MNGRAGYRICPDCQSASTTSIWPLWALVSGAVTGDENARREVVTALLCNLKVQDGRIASYQYKDPFGVLEMDSSGAFCHSWWALEDLNL